MTVITQVPTTQTGQMFPLKSTTNLVCVGAGPKSISVALLANILKRFGLANIEVSIIEQHTIAANWDGSSGYTDGAFPLDTSPFKDLGFPYKSGFGDAVDHELGHYSFIEYLKQRGEYASWVSRGNFKISHHQFALYLRWVTQQINPTIINATLKWISPQQRRVEMVLNQSGQSRNLIADGLLLTGPGVPKMLAGVAAGEGDGLVFNARTYWMHRERFRNLRKGRVAVIGGGQSAGTIAKSILQENPDTQVEIINRMGFLRAQSAGFHENSLCTNPVGWGSLPITERREILNQINNGVLEASIKQFLDQHSHVNLVRGSVLGIHPCQTKENVQLELSDAPSVSVEYDRVIMATGFDPIAQLKNLIPANLVPARWFYELADQQNVDYHFRLPDLLCNIHMPSLGGLSQGPGFMLLSCLGSVASRVVSAYAPSIPHPSMPADTTQKVSDHEALNKEASECGIYESKLNGELMDVQTNSRRTNHVFDKVIN